MEDKNQISEEQLLQAISEGSELAFRKLFDTYRETVFHYLVNITKSREASEELLTDIFLKLWEGHEWITSINNMEAFLRRASYNKAIDYLRHVASRRKLQEAIALEIEKAQLRSPEQVLIEKDYEEIIAQAIDQLSPQRRAVFKLSREGGLTHREIATKLDISINTVNNHIKASLQLIRNFLSERGVNYLLWGLVLGHLSV